MYICISSLYYKKLIDIHANYFVDDTATYSRVNILIYICYTLVSDAKTKTNDKPLREAPIVPRNFEVGSMIQFGGDPIQYGVIKQIHGEFAEVELVSSTKLFPIRLQ